MKQHATTPFRLRSLSREMSLIFGASTLLAMPLAQAAPQGGSVTAGQASIQQNGALTTVTQGSQRAAIDWRSFNVGANETVNFVQPNASAAILNRVVGNDPSAIFGRITANGQVLLINPNGILFGRTAQVDVGALTATTSNLSNADFMAGRLQFNEPGKPGATVENQGRITVAEGGFAAFVGRQVANSGVITARLGKVALAGGDAFVLDLYGDKLVNLVVDPAAMTALTDASGQPLAARVDHSGDIVADGGRVQLSVATVKRLVDNLINLSGTVRATSFTSAPGLISLHGDANTRVNVSGTLDTSGERGGRVDVTGREVHLHSGASLAATGGQGSIAVGGDWQGRGALAHADTVNVAQGATLDASGGTHGDGGTVVLWSDKNTQFAGRIDANGGSTAGNAGQVEVSSKGTLGFQGDVGVFATNGQQGSLLLDPLNLTIAATSSGDSQVSADQLRYFLTRGTNVTLSADQNVTVDAEVNGLVSGGGGTAGGGLTLTAGNNLAVNQSIVLNNGTLNLTATNGTLSQANGTVLYTGSGAANLRGGAGVDLGQVLSGGAVDIRSAGGAVTVRNALVSATANGAAAPVSSLVVGAAGSVSLSGALVQGNAQVTSTNGAVSLANAVLQSNAGNVLVTAGTTVSSAANNVGIVSGGVATVTAGGAIDLGVLASSGTASLSSTSAGVTVRQAIAGVGGTATQGLDIHAAGPVSLAGARAGSGGISVLTTSGDITSQGASAAQGGLVSSGGVQLVATTGHAGTTAAPLRVQAGGDVGIDGGAGVTAATVLGAGDINLSSGAGHVTVSQAIAALAGSADASTVTRPTSVFVTARDAVDVSGAVSGAGGVSITSREGAVTVRNSIFSDGAVAVSAMGALSIQDGAGIATTQAGAAGSVSLLSFNGPVTLGTGGIRAAGTGSDISLTGATVTVNGDIQTRSGTITLEAGTGGVQVLSSGTSNDAALNATLDAGNDAALSRIVIHSDGSVDVGEMIAYNSIYIHTNAGDVTLRRGLGGNASGVFAGSPVLLNTGYVDLARGYLSQYRPNVGSLYIATPGSVELNGLNLDGNANATDTTPGLSITAGRRIVSNNEIAVNKGDIVLTSTGTGATDGVYLGSSVYSRGYDSVGTDGVRGGSDDLKIGYGIRIGGRVLGLFDNTLEMAQLPVNNFIVSWYEAGPGNPPPLHQVRTDAQGFVVDTAGVRVRNPDGSYQMVGVLSTLASLNASDLAVHNVTLAGVVASGPNQGIAIDSVRGEPAATDGLGNLRVVTQEIAKIEIANNVANYQDPANVGTLVAPTTGTAASREIAITTPTIAGVANHTAQTPMRLAETPVLTTLTQTPIVSAPTQSGVVAATHGIGLKLLSFRESGDASSQVWNTSIRMADSANFSSYFFRVDGASLNQLVIPDLTSTVPVEGVFSVTVPALAVRTYRDSGNQLVTEVVQLPNGAGTATHTFRIETSGSSELARLEQVTLANVNLSSLSNSAPSGATQVSAWSASGWRDLGTTAIVRLSSPALSRPGTADGVALSGGVLTSTGSTTGALQSSATIAPNYELLVPRFLQPTPFGALQPLNPLSEPRTFQVTNVLADAVSTASSTTRVGTRVFVYDGVIDTSNGTRTFDSNTGVAIPGLGGIPGFNNSTVGFAGVGAGFGAVGNGTAGSTGVGSTSGQGVTGATIPGGLSGTGTAPPLPVVEDRSTQDVANGGANSPEATGQPGSTELAFSVRPAAEADLGRGQSVPGSAVNVFKRLYRLATSSSPGVCAPGVVQQAPSPEGGTGRDCPAK
ncbi:filamentous hemagglutinin N-terminal domain-containing protein [Piscinibacter gummiphilus]|uniref:Filamentous hemagglutinin N-terminal domain-containing protein n=1 Tax=Piscinibacter gummiphilus TaxID=946333 RepID=A0ABZ0CUM9_9BURK|nr:filamentous hemagglutinin N-terminal domain-containing protein [Piscinibacter gummiphilus]WOB06598.1 filamentous hemagglutinin N-terminal domain-containing protein [Piscinibacter gummiphilus]